MTHEEALRRFKIDLDVLRQVCSHTTDQMAMYECAIEALEKELKVKQACDTFVQNFIEDKKAERNKK